MLLEREDVSPDIEPNTAQRTFPGGGAGEGLVKILLELGDVNLGAHQEDILFGRTPAQLS